MSIDLARGDNILGIDIGGVIIERVNNTDDTSFLDQFLQTAPVEGAIQAIANLNREKIFSEIFLVSKCGPRIENITIQWLEKFFIGPTDIDMNNVKFCRERSQKFDICRNLNITHFIDDRLEVLSYLEGVENLYLFQPQLSEVEKYCDFLGDVNVIYSWNELLKIFGSTAR